jgi:putative membrane protein
MENTARYIIIALVVIFTLIFAVPFFFAIVLGVFRLGYGNGLIMPGSGMMNGFPANSVVVIVMLVLMLLFIIAVVLGIILLIRWALRSSTPGNPVQHDEALAILKRRYAAGEITKEQYEQMKNDLLSP